MSIVDDILDKAFRRAKLNSQNIHDKNLIFKAKKRELVRIETVRNIVISEIDKIILKVPQDKQLSKFYKELFNTFMDWRELKKAFVKMKYIKKIIDQLFVRYKNAIKITKDTKKMARLRKEFYGRVASVLRRNAKYFEIIELAHKYYRKFPIVKPYPTVVIAGLPNVGKSTLLYKLTGSRPDIQPYPFTTKNIMIGYIKTPYFDIQIIDTPGVLDRPLENLNPVEKRSILALDLLAHYIVYVIDVTETCGFSLKEQLNLLNQIEKEFSKPIIIYFSKSDLFEDKHKEIVEKLSKELSKPYFIDPYELKDYLITEIKKRKDLYI